MVAGLPALSFDRSEQTMLVGMAGLRFETRAQIKAAFDAIHQFWTLECSGNKVYCVVDYTDFSLHIALTETYAEFVKTAVDSYGITTIRYTTDLSARATMRAVAIKTHRPSNLYATREDAMAVVRGLRASRIALRATG
jgi:hypothetical protein